MGCGCNKRKAVMRPPASASERVAAAKASGQVVMHDVYDADGVFVASYSNPVTARAEARRRGGSVASPRTGGEAAPRLPDTPSAETPTTPEAAVAQG